MLDEHVRKNPSLLTIVEQSGIDWIPIAPGEAYAAGSLPMHHRDPFDRLIVAQTIERSAELISHDEALDLYGIRRLWL